MNSSSRPPRATRIVVSLFDHPAYPGGGPVVVRRIIERLSRDYEVILVTTDCHGEVSGRRPGVRVVELPVHWAGPRLGQLLFHPLLILAALLIRHDLWIESFTPPFSSSLLPVVTRRPVIGLAQSLSARGMARKYRLPALVSIERFALRLYHHVIVLNPRDRDLVRACNPTATVRLIPNAITTPRPPSSPPGAGSYCLFLGRLDISEKGLDLLADAYQRAGADVVPLIVAGSGTRTAELRLAKLLRPLAGRARPVGYVHGARKDEILDGAAFLVMPSREEAFGLVALEALAHGKPVVHFDLPELSWIPADCSAKVAPFDVPGLVRAIEELSRDTARRIRLGSNARVYAERQDAAATDDAYAALVAEVLATADRPPPTGPRALRSR